MNNGEKVPVTNAESRGSPGEQELTKKNDQRSGAGVYLTKTQKRGGGTNTWGAGGQHNQEGNIGLKDYNINSKLFQGGTDNEAKAERKGKKKRGPREGGI